MGLAMGYQPGGLRLGNQFFAKKIERATSQGAKGGILYDTPTWAETYRIKAVLLRSSWTVQGEDHHTLMDVIAPGGHWIQ